MFPVQVSADLKCIIFACKNPFVPVVINRRALIKNIYTCVTTALLSIEMMQIFVIYLGELDVGFSSLKKFAICFQFENKMQFSNKGKLC